MKVPKWDRTKIPVEYASPVCMPHSLQIPYENLYYSQMEVYIYKQIRRIVFPPGNNFDLEVGQRSSHGMVKIERTCQGSCMPNINALSLILQKIEDMSQVKVFLTDRQTDE